MGTRFLRMETGEMVEFTTGIGYCSSYSRNLFQSVSSIHCTSIEKPVTIGLPYSEWLSLVAVGHVCKWGLFHQCIDRDSENTISSEGLNFLNLKWVSNFLFHLLTRYEVISLTFAFHRYKRWSCRYWSSRLNLLRLRKKYFGRCPISCHQQL